LSVLHEEERVESKTSSFADERKAMNLLGLLFGKLKNIPRITSLAKKKKYLIEVQAELDRFKSSLVLAAALARAQSLASEVEASILQEENDADE